jgi:selenocysteine lyase/cysteine desulfurase
VANFEKIREQFPIVKEWLYFDASSLSPYCLPVLSVLEKFQKERKESGSIHYDDWYGEIEEGRKQAAKITGAKESEIALTKNTSEGINLTSLMLDWEKGDNVVLTVEPCSVCQRLQA